MMSVKKMIDLYITHELSETTWDMMREMTYHGLISLDNWTKFYDKCKGWTFDEDEQNIIDWDGKVLYGRDAEGRMVKAA